MAVSIVQGGLLYLPVHIQLRREEVGRITCVNGTCVVLLGAGCWSR